ncbi:thiol peroxidase [Pseudobdellovibrio sp. HCB154]|uniref:thiol peroxidase n=1 Tax=Pseudobdellovibrio sp. HCB154 TaxID=3386277 RepID=UPI003916D14D
MASLKFRGNPANTNGNLPTVGQKVTFSKLVKSDLSEATNSTYSGKRKVLNIFPSIDTGTCAASVRQFNKLASDMRNTVVLNVSLDLPFAQSRFCGAEGIKNCESLSGFKSSFGTDWGLSLTDSPLAGLYARAVVVLSEDDKVLHTELVGDIVDEPNYEAALKALA